MTIQALRTMGPGLVTLAYCETHDDWHPLWRRATAAESVGIQTLPLPDEAPF